MRRIGLFVDTKDLFSNIARQYAQRRLDYEKYYEFVADLGFIECAIAYGAQKYNEAEGFRNVLAGIGYQTKYRRLRIRPSDGAAIADNKVLLTVDVMEKLGSFDCLVLGSSDKGLLPLVKWCREQGTTVIILACDVGKSLQAEASKVIEIPFSLLVSDD
jgi:uncharacterized LabA/DUF88 family protein